jgi:hypothetical protein
LLCELQNALASANTCPLNSATDCVEIHPCRATMYVSCAMGITPVWAQPAVNAIVPIVNPAVVAHGKPVAFYTDKHGVFRVNSTGAVQGDGMTQFGRSLHALNIDILCANTPQAKGRVERRQQDLAGSPGQGIASSPDQRDRRRQ